MRRAPDHVVAEHGALLRHWAGLQARVSEQMCAQDRRCAALEQELMRWRARWMVAKAFSACAAAPSGICMRA